MLKNMNRSVDPCDDFYEFTCGNFIAEADRQKSSGVLSNMGKSLEKIQIKFITEPIQPNDLKSIKMAKSLYKSCMDIGNCQKINLKNYSFRYRHIAAQNFQ